LRSRGRLGILTGMERTQTEVTLDEMIPRLEAEHDAELDDEARDLIWALINRIEEYLLMRDEKRKQ
jgi:hypothetical protein